jgi:hypothetical protein
MDKKSSYTPLTNRQHNSIPAAPTATTTTTATKASKKTSGYKSQPSNAVKNVAGLDKAPKKNVTATTTKPRLNDSSAGAKDQKVDAGTTRRLSCPPAGTTDNAQVTATLKGRSRAATSAVPTARKGAGATATDAVLKGRRRAGEEEQRPKLGSHAKK